jgi:hypothetical protein
VEHPSGVKLAEIEEMRSRLGDFAVDSILGCGQRAEEENPAAVVAALVSLAGAAVASEQAAIAARP